MKNDKGLVAEVKRIRALLLQNQPLLWSLKETCKEFSQQWEDFVKIRVPQAAMGHPAPVFTALRFKYMQISEQEKHLYPQYCIFWNKVNDALQIYEYVEAELDKIGGPLEQTGLFSDDQFKKLRELIGRDKNFAYFIGVSEDCPQQFAEEWTNMELVSQMEECIQRMSALRAEMISQLEGPASDND